MEEAIIFTDMNFKTTVIAAAAICCPAAALAQQPSAQAILEGARVAATLTEVEDGISGELSRDGRRLTDIQLFLKGKNIQFMFQENGPHRFHMRLEDSSYDLFEVFEGGRTIRFPDSKITSPIAGSDLTYEDLSLRFFYWPNPTLEGIEEVNGQPCYKLRVNKPGGVPGRYDTVYIWVHTKFGAFMQVKGYNSGKLLKSFQVLKVMKISEGVWTLEQMRVTSYRPDEEPASSTLVVFKTPKKAGPKGLR